MRHTHPTDATARPAHIHQQCGNLFPHSSRPFMAGHWLRRLVTMLPLLAVCLAAFLAPGTARAADLKVTAVAAGGLNENGPYSHSLFVTDDGRLGDMGRNDCGQLGDGTYTDRNTPVLVNGATNVIAVAAGASHSLFVTADGRLWAMGDNAWGQLGDGTYTTRNTPVLVNGGTNVIAVAAGGDCSLFVTDDGRLWAMGDNFYGQLGDGAITDSNTPVLVNGGTNVIAVAAGNYHSLFVTDDGRLWAMGNNSHGQLGDGTNTDSNTPVLVNGATNVIAVAAGSVHSLFVTADGRRWGMGQNSYGQLGDGTYTDKNTPVMVAGNTVIAVAAGAAHSLFVTADGRLWAMGYNFYGQLGNGMNYDGCTNTPVLVNGGTNVIAVAARDCHSLFVTADGKLWGMGANWFGQLGDGVGYNGTNTPVLINTNALVSGAPVIIAHPATQTVTAGDNVTFSVLATGSSLSYQWLKNSVNISGATSADYRITNVQQSDAGSYSARVSNPSGTATSNIATLTVNGGGNSGGGGGGGGAPSLWYAGAIACLAALRMLKHNRQRA